MIPIWIDMRIPPQEEAYEELLDDVELPEDEEFEDDLED